MSDKSETDDFLAAKVILGALDPEGRLGEEITRWCREAPKHQRRSHALALDRVARSKDKPHSWLAAALRDGFAMDEAEKARSDVRVLEGVGLEGKVELGKMLAALYRKRHGQDPPPRHLDADGGLPLRELAQADPELHGWVSRESSRYAQRRTTTVEANGMTYECVAQETPALMLEALKNGIGARGIEL